jgi:hypothetical protein
MKHERVFVLNTKIVCVGAAWRRYRARPKLTNNNVNRNGET